ncbi:MAG TPA: alpha/beta hydrolase [Thermoanaerobaculia bacterium]|nr:alpha/beta hydrolase [Thermoanaerobaculia bacterium]
MTRDTMLRSILITAAITLVAIYAFARYARRASMFFPDRFPIGLWDVRGLAVAPEDHYFTTSDGVRLHGWVFRAAGGGEPVIIWFHGNGGNVSNRAPMAAELARRGISVFLAEWRGYGRSEGRPTESGLYHDALAAYDYAVENLGAAPRSIVVYGESLGGPYAAYVASRREVRAVIIENSFPSLADLGNALYAPIPVGWTAPRAMTTTRWLNEAGVPVLVMHGRRDHIIPFSLGKKLYDGIRGPKEMLVSETALHSEIPAAEPERYYGTIERFIREAGASSPAPR